LELSRYRSFRDIEVALRNSWDDEGAEEKVRDYLSMFAEEDIKDHASQVQPD
jgi:hypothetical protein